MDYGKSAVLVRCNCSCMVAIKKPRSTPGSIEGGAVDDGVGECVSQEDGKSPPPNERRLGQSKIQPRTSRFRLEALGRCSTKAVAAVTGEV